MKPFDNTLDSLRSALPFSEDAERGVLGSMLLNQQVGLEITTKITAEHFYHPHHQNLFRILLEILNQGKPVDPILIYQSLKDRNLFDSIGGEGFIAGLIADTFIECNYQHYVDIVVEKYHLRKLKTTCIEALESINAGTICSEILDKTQTQFLDLTKSQSNNQPRLLREITGETLILIQNIFDNKGKTIGLASGIKDLDDYTSGFNPGEMIVVAARPGCGKSALALNIADHVALEKKNGVLFFTLEMPATQVCLRLISARAEVNFHALAKGWIHQDDFKRINQSVAAMDMSHFWLDEAFSNSITQIRLKARSVSQKKPLSLIIIDYLGLIEPSNRGRFSNRENEISEISRGIKAMALELGVPVLALCQLNREGGKTEPKLHHLRDSGSIEQDADIVMMLHSQSFDDPNNHPSTTTLSIEKNRRGPTGKVDLEFTSRWTKFRSPKKEAA